MNLVEFTNLRGGKRISTNPDAVAWIQEGAPKGTRTTIGLRCPDNKISDCGCVVHVEGSYDAVVAKLWGGV